MGLSRRITVGLAGSAAFVAASPALAEALPLAQAATSTPLSEKASAGQAVAESGEAGDGRARLLFEQEGVRYDVRTIRMGPCYGALDAKGSGRRTYATARFYSYGSNTCRDEFAAETGPYNHAPISKATVGPGQWWYSPVWYLDSRHNATVCVSIDGMRGLHQAVLTGARPWAVDCSASRSANSRRTVG